MKGTLGKRQVICQVFPKEIVVNKKNIANNESIAINFNNAFY